MQDQVTGLSYHQIGLAIPGDETACLENKTLVPGMPVEAFVQTGARTILSSLVQPLIDHMAQPFGNGDAIRIVQGCTVLCVSALRASKISWLAQSSSSFRGIREVALGPAYNC